MTYKRLFFKADENTVLVKKVLIPDNMDRDIYVGKEVTVEFTPKIYLKNTKGYLPDFLTGGTSILIISSKVKQFLEQSSEIRFLKFIETKITSRTITEKFYMVNILEPISCIDREKSIFEIPPENPDAIILLQKMVIDENKTKNRKLFYMIEFPAQLLIEESFANEMLDAGIKDIRLLPLVGSTI